MHKRKVYTRQRYDQLQKLVRKFRRDERIWITDPDDGSQFRRVFERLLRKTAKYRAVFEPPVDVVGNQLLNSYA